MLMITMRQFLELDNIRKIKAIKLIIVGVLIIEEDRP